MDVDLLDNALPPSIYGYLQRHLAPLLKIERLAGGHQHSWLLETETERLVLRLNQQQPCYGLDYQREREVLQQLEGLPWVISLHSLSYRHQFLLYYYQVGEVVSAQQWQQPTLWQQVLAILEQLPARGRGLPFFDMPKYLQAYVSDVKAKPAQGWRAKALAWLERQQWPSGVAFNHHDLHLDNLLLTPEQRLLVLDWEYAACSMAGWDAASVAQRCPVDLLQRQQLQQLSGLSGAQFDLLVNAVALLDLAWYWQYQPELPLLAERSQAWLMTVSA